MHECVSDCARVCVCVLGFFFLFYCLCVLCSGTLYSAVVLLVSIKFRFILGYSSVWYETQRQDRVSVGRPIKTKQHLVTVCRLKTNRLNKDGRDTNTAICPENYIFWMLFSAFFFFLIEGDFQSRKTALKKYFMILKKIIIWLLPHNKQHRYLCREDLEDIRSVSVSISIIYK